MYYKQLKDFLRQSEQKAFWLFTYANIAGVAAGFFVARYLSEALPWMPAWLLFPALMLAGLACTWPREGRATYKTWMVMGQFLIRRLLSPRSLEVSSATYYRVEQSSLKAFALPGRITYLGGDKRPTAENRRRVR